MKALQAKSGIVLLKSSIRDIQTRTHLENTRVREKTYEILAAEQELFM
jgi:hypothetical protein